MTEEDFELKLQELIDEAHRSGLSYWQALRVFIKLCQTLMMQADAEYYAKKHQT